MTSTSQTHLAINGNMTKINVIDNDNSACIKKRRRRVTFCTQELISVQESTGVTKEDRANSWYSPEELESMRNYVKDQAKKFRNAIGKSKDLSKSKNMSSLVMPFHNSGVERKMRVLCKSSRRKCGEFRGLEPKIFVERQRNRVIATKTIMEYQRRTEELLKIAQSEHHSNVDLKVMREGFANRLGSICAKLSSWSKAEALAIARYDETGVYGPLLERTTPTQDTHTVEDYQKIQTTVTSPSLKERSMNRIKDHIMLESLKRDRISFENELGLCLSTGPKQSKRTRAQLFAG